MSVFTDKWIDEHKDELVEKLQQCVRINSVRDDGSTREGAPFGEGAAKCLEDTLNTAKEMGFEVKNLDGYCGTVDYGTGEEQLGILAHLDVVPEGEGWTYPPYAAEIHDGRLYGRGTMDDKGPAFAALFGMMVLYFQCGSMSFTAGGFMTEVTPLTLTAVFCMILGFSAKAGLFPLHNWLPSAHPVAPAPAHALLSGVIAKVGAVAVIRTIYCMVGAELLRGTWVQTACLCLALVTIFMGSFMGCTENGLKKRLAYSSISQISYVLLGVFILSPLGLTGALLQIFFHAAAKIGVFQSAGAIIYLTDVTTIDRFPALGKRIPVTMICFTMLSLSLVGIPPFGGFHSKWYLAIGALKTLPGAMGYVIPAVLLASALFTAAYLFSPIVHSFFPGRDFPTPARVREPAAMMLSLVVFSASVLLLGLFPNGVISAMRSIAEGLM